ncbi:MAG: UDP-N-acetylmuramoyl-tripeptide--D-alanyl-D-alanine ligase [Candidatus Brocadiae bacterium]|nr:UDP-N-acetylmuramoyl-tripeptide--D-alanyl-D-alanine ligase [Candidatus Brocadiia bacterium]
MLKLSLSELIQITGGKTGNSPIFCKDIQGLSTDSRNILPGQCFLAIKGEKYDGHNFILDAIQKDASAIIANESYPVASGIPIPVIQVPQTLDALEKIALHHYKQFPLLCIAITGSVGKTTTKHLACSILSNRFGVLKSPKSFNNSLGVSLTLLELESIHKVLVMELGANAPGEIAHLTKMIKPDIGLITCVAPCHLEGFHSLSGVEQAKSEILLGMGEESVFITNADDCACQRILSKFPGKTVTFSLEKTSDFHAQNIRKEKDGIAFKMNGEEYFSPLPGLHNLYNLLASMAIATQAGMTPEEIKDSLSSLQLPAMRMEVKQSGGITVINDAYNANPKSMTAALEYLEQFPSTRKIAVLGSMLELGKESHHYHALIGKEAAAKNLDFLFAIGKEAKDIAIGAKESGMPEDKIFFYDDNINIEKELLPLLKQGDVVLLKASRRIKLEELVSKIIC